MEQNIQFVKDKLLEQGTSNNAIKQSILCTSSKILHCHEKFFQTFHEEEQSFGKISQQFETLNEKYKTDTIYNAEREEILNQEKNDLIAFREKISNNGKSLADFQQKVEASSCQGWTDIKTCCSGEEETNRLQVKILLYFTCPGFSGKKITAFRGKVPHHNNLLLTVFLKGFFKESFH